MNNFFTPDFYIDRKNEFNEITSGLLKNGAVAITGDAGIGKTVLSKLYAKENPLKFSRVYYYKASEFNYNEPEFNGAYLPFHTNDPILTIIDGVDEINAEFKGQRVINHFMEALKFGHKLIITYRTYLFYFGNPFNAYEIKLKGLSESQAITLIKSRIGINNLRGDSISTIKRVLTTVQNNPLGIVAAAELLRSTNLTINEVIDKIYDRLNYNDPIFEQEVNSRFVLPQRPEIVTHIQIINTSLVEKVKSNHNFIYSMSTRQFEEFVAELFEKDGYNVSLTKQTHDGGKDMFIVENKKLGKFIYYLECKKYSPHIPVGVRLVRELYGTVISDRVTAGLLVTSSYFSKQAIEFTEQIKTQMSLMEFVDLKKWILELPPKSKGS